MKKEINYEEYLFDLYHDLISKAKSSRKSSMYFKKKGSNEKYRFKCKGKQRVLMGLIIKLEKDLGFRLAYGETYLHTIRKNGGKRE